MGTRSSHHIPGRAAAAVLLMQSLTIHFAPARADEHEGITFHFDSERFHGEIQDTFDGQVRGFSFAVTDSEGIRALSSGGFAQAPGDGDVPMRTFIHSGVGSVSKMLSGIALLNLFDKHVLSDASVQDQLDMKIWDKLPRKWQEAYADRNFADTTYRQLLQHRSGFRLSSGDLPASSTGHQMRTMIDLDVLPEDIGVRSYNNFNFTILLFLIPAIAYPDEVAEIHEIFEDLDIVPYSISINAWYGVLYERYMQEEIFPNTIEFPITPTCRPAQDLAGDAYAKYYDSALDAVGEVLNEDGSGFCRSQGSWYLTALDLARFARTYAFTNTYIGPTTRASLVDPAALDDRLLYNRLVTNTGFAIDQSEFAFHGGTQEGYRAALVALPYGFFGVGMANSPEFTSSGVAQGLIDAFQAAIEDTPPIITPTVNGVLGNNGWYVSNVSVGWSVVDPNSEITGTSGCGATVVHSDTSPSGQTITCTATSLGGTASESVTIRRDVTAPSAAVLGVQDGDSFAAVEPPDVSCSASDPLPGSGVVDASPDPEISDDGGGYFTASCAAEDFAGNQDSASATYRLVALEVIAGTVAGSGLNDGNKNSLLVMLRQAGQLLDEGMFAQAVNVMQAFANHVTALVQAGALTAEEGQSLLSDIAVLIAYYG
jgi:CubicO group peptidase (beta-lactamase class C family)